MVDLKAITPLACDPGLLEHGDGLLIPFRDDIILMQFTGLQDKNGRDIYEGDIVEENSSDHSRYEIVWDDKHACFKLNCKRVSKATQYPSWNRGVNMVIIGNIYENPELIKQA